MKVIVAEQGLRRILRWTQRALFAGAALLLGYCAFIVIDTWMFQRSERRALETLLTGRQAELRKARQSSSPALSGKPPAAVADGTIGRLELPRLGLSVIVVEGISKTTLRRAVGHIPDTALPGQSGNIGIAGHRDTFFRPLKDVQPDDIITLTTLLGEFRYRVVSTMVVRPHHVAVLDSSAKEILTLVTCYPFYFVGSAPDRFIVQAERIT